MPKPIVNQLKDDAYGVMLQTITAASQLPGVKVDRESFLRQQFKDDEYLDIILAEGPQAVYSLDSLQKRANKIIDNMTLQTAGVAFALGLPSNPLVAGAAGAADVVQYFGFALNMGQQIAYLFGEADLFQGNHKRLPEEVQFRVVTFLGVMMGVAGSQKLLRDLAKPVGQYVGKRVARQALTKTVWYPLVKKVGKAIGLKVTRQTVQKTIEKGIPILGGVIGGGLTFMSFAPMGQRLVKTFIQYHEGDFDEAMAYSPAFKKRLAENKKNNQS